MTIDELLEHYRYKLALPNLTQHSRTIAEATYSHLKKRKPMKPVGWNNEWMKPIGWNHECCNCGTFVSIRENYCPICGQAIDWGD